MNHRVISCQLCLALRGTSTLLSPSTVMTGIPRAFTCCFSPGPMAAASCCRMVRVCCTWTPDRLNKLTRKQQQS